MVKNRKKLSKATEKYQKPSKIVEHCKKSVKNRKNDYQNHQKQSEIHYQKLPDTNKKLHQIANNH